MNKAFIHRFYAVLIVLAGLSIKVPYANAQHGAAPSVPPSTANQLSATHASATHPAAGEASKTAEQVFKNIQALKGTPADQLQTAMQFISNSLGVECAFCHVQDAFEKDDKKPKQTARQMIQMQLAINRDNFKGEREVTCYSCHHGSEHPAGIPIIADEEPKRQIPQDAAAMPSADQIIDKYVQAVGGADALQKITSRVQKATIIFGDRQFPAEVLSKSPNKRISTMHTPNGDNITAFDGHAGWLGNPGGRPPRDMTAQESEAISFDATFYLPTEIKKMFAELRVRPAEKIARHEVYQVIGSNPGKPPVRLYFDQVSGLLLRTIRYAESPLGRNPTQVDYAEYRIDSGVKLPFQWTVARPLGRFTIQVAEIQQNVPIDDSKFTKPAAAPEQKPAAK
ncbi:MAG TPA: c-type cytochrome [Candidatus Acidoferrum sp.]|nr:c-type cytochrome [Candidatus Acidoferrum sp.]